MASSLGLPHLIREAYSEVFDVVDPAQDSQDRILNVFRRYTPASQRNRMVIFFLGMCREAGIETLDVPRQRTMSEPRQRSTATTATQPSGRTIRGQVKGAGKKLSPALEGLVSSLPPEGEPLSAERREQWLAMARATLDFVYPVEVTTENNDEDND